MSRLPVISGLEAVAALERIGYRVVRQKGSHMRLRNSSDSSRQPLTVPNYSMLKSGTLRAIIRSAGLSVEQFVALLP